MRWGGDDINTKNKNVETSTFVDSLRFDRFLQEMGTRYNNMYTRSADEDSLPEIGIYKAPSGISYFTDIES